MEKQEKISKWLITVIIFVLTGVSIAVLLLVLNLFFKYFNFSDGINGGIIGAIGGIAGGSFTYFGVRSTLKNDQKKSIEIRRSYISIDNILLSYHLSKITLSGKKRVIETDYYLDTREEYPESEYEDERMVYLKLRHFGTAQFVFDLKININFSKGPKETIAIRLGIVENDENILIPLWGMSIPWKFDTAVKSIETTYYTEAGEQILYTLKFVGSLTYTHYFSIVNGEKILIRESDPYVGLTWTILN